MFVPHPFLKLMNETIVSVSKNFIFFSKKDSNPKLLFCGYMQLSIIQQLGHRFCVEWEWKQNYRKWLISSAESPSDYPAVKGLCAKL